MELFIKRFLLATSIVTGLSGFSAIAESEILIDGTSGLDNFNQLGTANWSAENGAIQATQGTGSASYLVTKSNYSDFHLIIEFWASNDANSGIFMRCQNPGLINDRNCYEANIYDQRPDPSFGTGGIVHIGLAPDPLPKAGGKWNTYEITLNGSDLLVVLNGRTTVDIPDSQFSNGHIALQWGQGTIRFRKFEIQPI